MEQKNYVEDKYRVVLSAAANISVAFVSNSKNLAHLEDSSISQHSQFKGRLQDLDLLKYNQTLIS